MNNKMRMPCAFINLNKAITNCMDLGGKLLVMFLSMYAVVRSFVASYNARIWSPMQKLRVEDENAFGNCVRMQPTCLIGYPT